MSFLNKIFSYITHCQNSFMCSLHLQITKVKITSPTHLNYIIYIM